MSRGPRKCRRSASLPANRQLASSAQRVMKTSTRGIRPKKKNPLRHHSAGGMWFTGHSRKKLRFPAPPSLATQAQELAAVACVAGLPKSSRRLRSAPRGTASEAPVVPDGAGRAGVYYASGRRVVALCRESNEHQCPRCKKAIAMRRPPSPPYRTSAPRSANHDRGSSSPGRGCMPETLPAQHEAQQICETCR